MRRDEKHEKKTCSLSIYIFCHAKQQTRLKQIIVLKSYELNIIFAMLIFHHNFKIIEVLTSALLMTKKKF